MAQSLASPTVSATATMSLVPPLAITNATLPNGTTGVLYSATLTATGGIPPYTWSLVSGALPPSLSLTPSSGLISGTPTTAGSYTFTVQARDTAGNLASQSNAISVAAPAGVPWGPTYYVSGQTGNDTWSGLLPSPSASGTDGPFQTLTKAQAAMRASSTVKIATILAGTYSISSIWAFTWADAGELWISYPGQTAVLNGATTGGVSVTGVSNLQFTDLTFQNMGTTGVLLSGGSTAVNFRWNTFTNCNETCIAGSGVTNSIIDSNIFNGQTPGNPSGSTSQFYSAISLSYGSSNNQITHNLIENCQGGGIAFNAGQTDPPNNNNIVDRNILQNVDTNVTDAGAIYMMDRSHSAVGNQITNNLIYGNGGTGYLTNQTKAIYLDDLMSNVLVSGNICQTCGEYAWQIHAGNNNSIVNNIFDLSVAGTLAGFYQHDSLLTDYGMAGNLVERNIYYFATTPPSTLYTVSIGSTDVLPTDSANMYFSAAGSTIPNTTIVDTNATIANPQFTSPSTLNYSMPLSSPAYTVIGFQALATNQGPLAYVP
jgi:hypothetical protein